MLKMGGKEKKESIVDFARQALVSLILFVLMWLNLMMNLEYRSVIKRLPSMLKSLCSVLGAVKEELTQGDIGSHVSSAYPCSLSTEPFSLVQVFPWVCFRKGSVSSGCFHVRESSLWHYTPSILWLGVQLLILLAWISQVLETQLHTTISSFIGFWGSNPRLSVLRRALCQLSYIPSQHLPIVYEIILPYMYIFIYVNKNILCLSLYMFLSACSFTVSWWTEGLDFKVRVVLQW